MKAEEIKDEASLRAWLEARPEATRRADALAISTRIAHRVFPLWVGTMVAPPAGKADYTALPILRLSLILAVACNFPTTAIKAAAAAARIAASGIATARIVAKASNVDDSRYFADVAASIATTATVAADAAAGARTAASRISDVNAAWLAVQSDARTLESDDDPQFRSLWSVTLPAWFDECDATARAIWARETETWSFWLRWWDGVLSGNQLDRDLQHEVALIPDAVWKSGPAAVAEEIRRIEERRELQKRAADLRAELERVVANLAGQASLAQRSHNNPPEVIDASASAQQEITVLVATLREVEVELAAPIADRSRVKALALSLGRGAATTLRYCAGLADASLQEGAKSVGKWAGAMLTAYLASEPVVKGVAALAEAILAFLTRLP